MSDDVKMFIQQKGFPFKYLTEGLAKNIFSTLFMFEVDYIHKTFDQFSFCSQCRDICSTHFHTYSVPCRFPLLVVKTEFDKYFVDRVNFKQE